MENLYNLELRYPMPPRINNAPKYREGTSGNAINGISPNNKNKLLYEEAAKREFGE